MAKVSRDRGQFSSILSAVCQQLHSNVVIFSPDEDGDENDDATTTKTTTFQPEATKFARPEARESLDPASASTELGGLPQKPDGNDND